MPKLTWPAADTLINAPVIGPDGTAFTYQNVNAPFSRTNGGAFIRVNTAIEDLAVCDGDTTTIDVNPPTSSFSAVCGVTGAAATVTADITFEALDSAGANVATVTQRKVTRDRTTPPLLTPITVSFGAGIAQVRVSTVRTNGTAVAQHFLGSVDYAAAAVGVPMVAAVGASAPRLLAESAPATKKTGQKKAAKKIQPSVKKKAAKKAAAKKKKTPAKPKKN